MTTEPRCVLLSRLSDSPRSRGSKALSIRVGDSVPESSPPPPCSPLTHHDIEGDPEYDKGSTQCRPSPPTPLTCPSLSLTPAAGGNSETACHSARTGGR